MLERIIQAREYQHFEYGPFVFIDSYSAVSPVNPDQHSFQSDSDGKSVGALVHHNDDTTATTRQHSY